MSLILSMPAAIRGARTHSRYTLCQSPYILPVSATDCAVVTDVRFVTRLDDDVIECTSSILNM